MSIFAGFSLVSLTTSLFKIVMLPRPIPAPRISTYMTDSGGRNVRPTRHSGTMAVVMAMAACFPRNDTITGNRKLARKLPMARTEISPPAAEKLRPASSMMDGRMEPMTRVAMPLTM